MIEALYKLFKKDNPVIYSRYTNKFMYHFKPLYNLLCEKSQEYIENIKKCKKTKNDEKLELLGLTSSKSYNYSITSCEEECLKLSEIYEKKYPNNIFIPDVIFNNINLPKIYNKDFNYTIPDEILDILLYFEIDSDDYKVFEYSNYIHSNPLPSKFTYKEIKKAITLSWGVDSHYEKNYLDLLENEKHTYIISTRVKLPNCINDCFKVEKKSFFIVSKFKKEKISFKDFIQNDNSDEYLILQPVKGGYLIISNW